MSSMLVTGGEVLDVATGELNEYDILAAGGRIVEVASSVRASDDAEVIDARGLVVMPGLIDAHVHVTAATADLSAISTWPVSYVTAHAATILRGMLRRGFTTVRDASGADFGLARAPREGLLTGPRIAFCGKALSQTGGHGDGRGPGQTAMEDTHYCAGLGRIADGVDAVRTAAPARRRPVDRARQPHRRRERGAVPRARRLSRPDAGDLLGAQGGGHLPRTA
jgi:imidazolonepropionase-like amidohydrolase